MSLKRVIGHFSMAVVAVGMSAGCGKKDSKKTGTNTAAAPTTPALVSTDFQLAGSLKTVGTAPATQLALDGVGAGLNIYCVTFEDSPKGCKADVDASTGAFNTVCKGFVGQAFGCFLRQENKTIGDVVFDQGTGSTDSALTAAPGVIKVDVNYDPVTKLVAAKVKADESTALKKEAIEQVKKALKVQDTSVADLTGSWKMKMLGCDDSEGKVAACGEKEQREMNDQTIYFHDYNVDGKRKVALWHSEASMNACLGSARDESSPQFHLTVGDSKVEFADSFKKMAAFETKVDQALLNFAATSNAAAKDLVKATASSWEADRCRRMEEQTNQFNPATFYADNTTECRLISMEIKEVKYFDPKLGDTVTRWEPEHLSKWSDVVSKANADESKISARQQTCFNPKVGPQPNMPSCPPELKLEDSQATSTMTVFDYKPTENEFRPLAFLCRAPDKKAEDENSVHWFPVREKGNSSSYFVASVTGIRNTFTSDFNAGKLDEGCKKDDNYLNLGISVYESQKGQIRRTFLNVLRNSGDGDGGYDMCSYWTKPDMSTFNLKTSCTPGSGSPLCYDRWVLDSLGVTVDDSGAFVPKQGVENDTMMMDMGIGSKFCPNVTFNPVQGDSQDPNAWMNAQKTYRTNCRTAFLNKTLLEQKNAFADYVFAAERKPPEVVLSCQADNSEAKQVLTKMATESCMPDVNLDMRCDQGKCVEVLRCSGTADGSCYDAKGSFQARIPNRMEVLNMKPGLAGSFDMNAVSQEFWTNWEDGKEKKCRAVHGVSVQSKLVNANEFNARLGFKENQACDGDKKEGEGTQLADEKKGDDNRSGAVRVKFSRQ